MIKKMVTKSDLKIDFENVSSKAVDRTINYKLHKLYKRKLISNFKTRVYGL